MSIEVKAWKCETCGNGYFDKKFADNCCVPKKCEVCGRELPLKWYRTLCEPCCKQQRYDNAVKMTYAEYIEKYPGNGITLNEDFYSDMESLLEVYSDETEEIPLYAWGTDKCEATIDIEAVIEEAEEETYEDAEFDHKDELIEFVKEWNDQNAINYYRENDIVVFVPEDMIAKYRGE